MGNILALFQLVQAVLGLVHDVEAALPGAPGAEKSQHVIDKVTPIATVVQASAPQIQTLIDAAVTMFKLSGVFKSKSSNVIDAEPTQATNDPAVNAGG